MLLDLFAAARLYQLPNAALLTRASMVPADHNPAPVSSPPRPWLRSLGVCVGLIAITLAVFAQTARFEFLNFDDDIMISANPKLGVGLSSTGIVWAFTANLTYHDRGVEYWQPLTAISRLADVHFFGLDAGRHHLTSVCLHLVAGLLLFAAMNALLHSTVRSAVIAALFLIHPLHVEPVAWLAARKDVLNGLFYFATIWLYAWYAARPNWKRYLAVSASFLCANMAKPMAVSLPLVLLLLDCWPLRRAVWPLHARAIMRLVAEKLPLFAIAIGVSIITIVGQQQHGAMGDAAMFPLAVRVGNAAISLCVYLGQTFVPVGLAIFYPHPGTGIDWLQALLSGACCILITAVAIAQGRARPWLLVGWLWFVVGILPVSGLVQIGEMARADRYTYVPLAGIFLLVVQQAAESLRAARDRTISKLTSGAFAAAVVAVLLAGAGLLAWKQTSTWRDSVSVFSHAIAVTDNNYVAHANLGSALFAAGRRDEGLAHYREAVRLHAPALAHHRRTAIAAEERGDWEKAVHHYGKIITLVPSDADVRQRLGAVLFRQGAYAKALVQFNEALRYQRDAVAPRIGIARTLIALSRFAEARALLETVLQLEPGNTEAQQLLRTAPDT